MRGLFEYLDRATVCRSLVDDHLDGRENRRLLIWSLLYFEEWLSTFIDGRRSVEPARRPG